MKWKEVESTVKKANSSSAFRRIEFREASKPLFQSTLSSTASTPLDKPSKHAVDKVAIPESDDSISGPVPGLCHPHSIHPYIAWASVPRNAPGLFNQGNTCYLNSTLQCLLHIPILTQYILSTSNSDSSNTAKQSTILHMYEKFVKEIWTNTSSKAISPRGIVQNIRRIGKNLRPMRQEDAHEFLRLFLDCMHEEILKSQGLQSNQTKYGHIINTTLISRVFGGYLRNELTCSKCGYQSRSYNHFHDLCLDIQRNVSNVMQSFSEFTKPEVLGRGNEWFCDKCKMKVKATKQMTVARGPMVLVLQLKRFSYGNSGGKISKQIAFPLQLALPLTDDSTTTEAKYELFGVVVHHGSSVHSGHYIAYVRAPSGQWCEMDDSSVSVVSVQRVLAVQAYMLFYTRSDIAPLPSPLPHAPNLAYSNAMTATSTDRTCPPSSAPEVVEIFPPLRLHYDDCARLPRILSLFLQPMRFRGAVFWSWRRRGKPSLRQATGAKKVLGSTDRMDVQVEVLPTEEEEKERSTPAVVPVVPALGVSMTRQLLNLSKRGRDLDGEGVWEGVSPELLAERRAMGGGARLPRKDQHEKEWHRELDQGRLKKVKGKKDEAAAFGGKNAFQEAFDKKRAAPPSW